MEPGTSVAGSGSIITRIVAFIPGSVVPAALALVTSMVFTRVFTPAAFGRYSLLLVLVTPIRLLCTTWLTQSIARFLPIEREQGGILRVKEVVLVSAVLILAVESLITLAGLLLARQFAPDEWHAYLLPVALFLVVTSLFEVLSVVFAAEARAGEFTVYKVIDSVATLALRLVFVSALFHMDIALMFWSVLVSNGVLVPVMWSRAGLPGPRRLLSIWASPETRDFTRSFVMFGMPMTVWFFFGVLLDVGDRYVLGYLMGSGPVGIYDANYRLIAGLASLMVVPIAYTLHPYLMRVAGSAETHRVGEVIGTIVESLLLVGATCVGAVALLHRDLGHVLLGQEFREGTIVMPVVLGGVFLSHVGSYTHKPFEIINRTRVMVGFSTVAAVANIALCFALIPVLGYPGAAYATLISYLLYAAAVGVAGRKLIPWRLNVRRLLAECGGVAVLVVAASVARSLLRDQPYVAGLAVAVASSLLLTAFALSILIKRRSSMRAH